MTDIDRHILAAQGYIELGLHAEAEVEINALPHPAQARADVQELRLLCCMGTKSWENALELARGLCTTLPTKPGGFIHAAYCLHELGRTDEALNLLLNGPPSLRQKAEYFYNLGCYSARLGMIAQALQMLEQAFQRKPALRQEARHDPDLASVREQLR
jgi:tetratricopeptide (TPR) repeat protein